MSCHKGWWPWDSRSGASDGRSARYRGLGNYYDGGYNGGYGGAGPFGPGGGGQKKSNYRIQVAQTTHNGPKMSNSFGMASGNMVLTGDILELLQR